MFTIGCHLSASKGYLAMAKQAVSIGANTFQFFTRNPRVPAVSYLLLCSESAKLDACITGTLALFALLIFNPATVFKLSSSPSNIIILLGNKVILHTYTYITIKIAIQKNCFNLFIFFT